MNFLILFIFLILGASFISSAYLGVLYNFLGIHNDLILHLAGFFMLGIAAYIYFKKIKPAILVSTFLAMILELIQYFLPRNAEISDFIMHSMSAILGIIIAKIFRKIFKNHK